MPRRPPIDRSIALLDNGIRVGCFRPPAVPAGTARLRLTARANLTDADLDRFRQALVGGCRPMRLIVVTGTGTGIGKTVTTAALAACALPAGQRVAVVKPIQTGVLAGEPADLAEVARLTGLADLHEYVRYAEPLAPATAARRLGEPGPALPTLADRIAELADRDLVIVEGAGGVLVRFNAAGDGLLELAAALRRAGWPDRSGAGLLGRGWAACTTRRPTARAARPRPVSARPHLVIGDWPAEPGLAERCNLADLPDYAGARWPACSPHGAGGWDRPGSPSWPCARSPRRSAAGFDAAEFMASQALPPPPPIDERRPADDRDRRSRPAAGRARELVLERGVGPAASRRC